ncbi:uncharacterized protein LOC126904582 [Daktulosphaira vitifoliae]|uniref:uncharacterized protein LOC126904582 n=1 Tax=Daktulosphaira vitifoliae TaxID=58002 RepID=UPI0021A9BF59|nr:uncharacterized protein LOC126904582 [Daktulosphaira vitifoliae]
MMENITMLKIYYDYRLSNEVFNISQNEICDCLENIAKLDPKTLTIKDYNELIKCLPLSPNENQHEVVAAAFKVLASLCSYDLARQYLGEKLIEVTIDSYKIFADQHFSNILKVEDCLAQTCRCLANFCYYHESNTELALKCSCLSISIKLMKRNLKENTQLFLNGLLMNLTHLNEYKYEFPVDVIEQLNTFGIQHTKFKFHSKFYIILISVIINVIKTASISIDILNYENCSIVDWLLKNHSNYSDIAYICVKFIKQVSKKIESYQWILNGKHKLLTEVLDKFEKKNEEDVKQIVHKICDVIVLLSNHDSIQKEETKIAAIYLVDWLLIKMKSKNLYVQLSAIRTLGNLARMNFGINDECLTTSIIIEMEWFVDTIQKSNLEKNSGITVSILCLFKNILYTSSFASLNKDIQCELVKSTIQILKTSICLPVIIKVLDVIECIIRKGSLDEENLNLYKNPEFMQQLKTCYGNQVKEIKDLSLKITHLLQIIGLEI